MACPVARRLRYVAGCVAFLSLPGAANAQAFDLSWRGHLPPGPSPSTDLGIPLDYDGDGDLDVLVKTGSVFVNEGGHRFTWSPPGDRIPLAGPFYNSFQAAGDVDGDGRVDLVRLLQFEVQVNRGLPGGYFATPTPAGSTGTWLFVAEQLVDSDGDGDLDLFAFGPNVLVHFRNQGNGTFVDVTAATLPAQSVSPGNAFADFDGDQDVDIVCVSGGTARLLTNNGGGSFSVAAGSGLPVGVMPPVRAADADADGDVDLLLRSATALQVWLNTGGVFSLATTMPPTASEMAFVDLNGDARAEIVLSDSALGRLVVLANTPTGFTQASSAALEEGAALGRPLPGDIDGDGDLDLIVGGTLAYLNQGNLQVRHLRELPFGFTTDRSTVVPFDADADGAIDVFCGDTLHRNRGDGFFTRTAVSVPADNTARAAIDVDGDGDVDVIWTSTVAQTQTGGILRNQGATWITQTPFAPGDIAGEVFAGDFDGDGRPDLVSAAGRVLRNAVTGFQVAATLPAGSVARAIGDFDGDGDPDLIVASGATWQVHQNQGGFVFQPIGAPQSMHLLRAAAGDLDGDSDVDLVTRHDQGGARLLTIWLNNGGVLQANGTLAELAPAVEIALEDVDGDGRPDILSAGVFVNQGGGTFQSYGASATSAYAGRAFDVDADGDIDIVRAGTRSGSTLAEVRVNRSLQLAAPQLAILGRQHRLEVTSRPGAGTGMDAVFTAMATARIPATPIPGLGVLHLDPASTVLLPFNITGWTGTAVTNVTLPASPSLAGAEVFWQALVFQPSGARLTNFLRDELLAP